MENFLRFSVATLILFAVLAGCGDHDDDGAAVSLPPQPPPPPPSPTVLFFDGFDDLNLPSWCNREPLFYAQNKGGNPGGTLVMDTLFPTYISPKGETIERFALRDVTASFDAKFNGSLYWHHYGFVFGAAIRVYPTYVEIYPYMGTDAKHYSLNSANGWHTFKLVVDGDGNYSWFVDDKLMFSNLAAMLPGIPLANYNISLYASYKVYIDNVKVTSP